MLVVTTPTHAISTGTVTSLRSTSSPPLYYTLRSSRQPPVSIRDSHDAEKSPMHTPLQLLVARIAWSLKTRTLQSPPYVFTTTDLDPACEVSMLRDVHDSNIDFLDGCRDPLGRRSVPVCNETYEHSGKMASLSY